MFDLIIDKSTIDAILCGEWAHMNVAIMLKECQRVLKTNGFYIAISYAQPKARELHFIRSHLKFRLETLELKKMVFGHETVHWMYIC